MGVNSSQWAFGWHENIRPCLDARPLDSASGSAMTAGIGFPDEQVTLGASRGLHPPRPVRSDKGTARRHG